MASGESKIFVAGKERILILLLCIAAAFRVFIFSAAFPFFSNIDEDLHFDLITQYSHAQVPRSFDRLREETLNWEVSSAAVERALVESGTGDCVNASGMEQRNQFRIISAAAVLRIGKCVVVAWEVLRIGGASIVVLDSVSECLACRNDGLAAYVTARTIAPERMDLRISVPLLLAFIPQNVFYAMNNDVLSPLCFGTLFLCVLQWLRTNAPSFLLGALTGVGLAATCLTKLSNLPLREIQPAISADDRQFDGALLQRLSDARGNEALSTCIDPADSD